MGMAQRTDKDMEASGVWAKSGEQDGKTVWRHASGATVAYDCMLWVWVARDVDGVELTRSRRLWWCRADVEAKCAVAWTDDDRTGV